VKRITLIVSGDVQKVGYRAKVVDIAREMGLTGFVENLDDGSVKIVAEGDAEALERFRNRIYIKNTLIRVSDIVQEYSGATGEFMDFEKRVKEGELHERADTAVEYLKKLIDVTVQGNTAIIQKQDQMLVKQDETLVAIKHMDKNTGERFDWLADRYGEFGRKMGSFDESMREMKEDIHQIKEDMHEMRDAFVRLVEHFTKEA